MFNQEKKHLAKTSFLVIILGFLVILCPASSYGGNSASEPNIIFVILLIGLLILFWVNGIRFTKIMIATLVNTHSMTKKSKKSIILIMKINFAFTGAIFTLGALILPVSRFF